MIKKAIVTAAGYGTRQFPATQAVQKELLPLVDIDGVTKPTIQVILEKVFKAGISEAALIVQPGAAGMRRHFHEQITDTRFDGKPEQQALAENLRDMSERITFIEQTRQQGFGHAVYCARDWAENEPFLLCLGDHVYVSKTSDSCIQQLLHAFAQQNASVFGLQQTPEHLLHLFGTVTGSSENVPGRYRLTHILEKPSIKAARNELRVPGLDQYLTLFGIYALVPDIFAILHTHIQQNKRSGGEIQLTPALQELIESKPVYGIEVQGERLDMGTPEGYLHTLTTLGLRGRFRKQLLQLYEREIF
ncbi:MAG: sugar phosphate nucleotidyltransferase [candidate division KSB1 bacterium]|nr:sugar phosphate nucleotidyltransferase [candidate division KSB1 bacterium]